MKDGKTNWRPENPGRIIAINKVVGGLNPSARINNNVIGTNILFKLSDDPSKNYGVEIRLRFYMHDMDYPKRKWTLDVVAKLKDSAGTAPIGE